MTFGFRKMATAVIKLEIYIYICIYITYVNINLKIFIFEDKYFLIMYSRRLNT